MKTKLFFIAAIMAVSPAYAVFNYKTTVASSSTPGDTCDSSTNPGKIYHCACEQTGSTHTCSQYASLPCNLTGTATYKDTTGYRVCHYESQAPCSACNCKTSVGSWQTAGENVVRRPKVTVTSMAYFCESEDVYEYGCSAGYYQTSVSGGIPICSPCPSLGTLKGTNAIGETAITTCYLPANKDGTDDTGTFHFTAACYYKN